MDKEKLKQSITIDPEAYAPIYVSEREVIVHLVNTSFLDEEADKVLQEDGHGGMYDEGCDNLWYNLWVVYRFADGPMTALRSEGITFETENHPDGYLKYTMLSDCSNEINEAVHSEMLKEYGMSLMQYVTNKLEEDA